MNIRVASGVDKVDMIHRLTEAAEKIAPGRDFKFRFMDEVIDQNYHQELRFTRQILLFSLIAIVLSMIGVFGLTLFESEYRRKEIGIRKSWEVPLVRFSICLPSVISLCWWSASYWQFPLVGG